MKDALQAEIDHAKRKRLIARKGTIDLNIDFDNLRVRVLCRGIMFSSTVRFGLNISRKVAL